MFEAFNQKENKNYIAIDAFLKFPEPGIREQEWRCCNESNCPHVKVTPVKSYHKNDGVSVIAHFSQLSTNELKCCNTNETDLHYNAKIHIYTLLVEEKLELCIGNTIIKIPEKTEINTEKTKEDNRADILIEFKKTDILFGKGIAIEIAINETEKSINEKTSNWAKKGFSISWLSSSDFEGYKLIKRKINVLPFLKLANREYEKLNEEISERLRNLEKWKQEIDLGIEKNIQNFKSKLEYDKEKIIEELKNRQITSCKSCRFSGFEKYLKTGEFTGLRLCWRDKNLKKAILPDGPFEPEYSCELWEPKNRGYKK